MSLRALLLSLCLAASSAHAGELGGRSGGIWGDLAIGLGAGGRPFAPGIGWTAAVGGFVGRHDDAFAVGRRWGVGLRARQDIEPQSTRRALRTAVMLDIHRGLDLLVAGVQLGGLVGPTLATPLDGGPSVPVGLTTRLTGAATWRVHRYVGLQVRLDVGVDLDLRQPAPVTAAPALGLTLGVGFGVPTRGG